MYQLTREALLIDISHTKPDLDHHQQKTPESTASRVFDFPVFTDTKSRLNTTI